MKKKQKLAAPVTPVSGNGTESRNIISRLRYTGGRLRTDLNDAAMLYPKSFHLEAVAQLIAEWDAAIKDAVTFEMAGTASHSGQGWDTATELLKSLMLDLHYTLDIGGKLNMSTRDQMRRADEYLNSLVPKVVLPAPPSEADGQKDSSCDCNRCRLLRGAHPYYNGKNDVCNKTKPDGQGATEEK